MPDYGLPDLVTIYQGLPDSITTLQQAIKHTLEKYEPRLKYVEVKNCEANPVDCVIQLEITGYVEEEPCHFMTYFKNDGMTEVRA